MTCIAFHVHDGINADGVCVGAGAGSDDDNLASDMFADVLVGFVHVHHGGLHLRNMDRGEVNGMDGGAVAVEEGVTFGQLFVVNNQRVLETHLLHQLFGRFNGFLTARNRQRETQLCLTVVHRVAIRLYFG